MSLSRASGVMEANGCRSDADCTSFECPEGLSTPHCLNEGYCTCKPTQEGSKDGKGCQQDSDCIGFCPPHCKYVNCVAHVCFCGC